MQVRDTANHDRHFRPVADRGVVLVSGSFVTCTAPPGNMHMFLGDFCPKPAEPCPPVRTSRNRQLRLATNGYYRYAHAKAVCRDPALTRPPRDAGLQIEGRAG